MRAAGVRAAGVVAWREIRDNWLTGRGLLLMLAYTLLLSVTTYLAATNEALTFLEQREALALVVRVVLTVGGLLVVLWCADAVSGERERGTLESLLLTPVPRRSLVAGKGLSALTLWAAAYLFALPYLWILGRGVSRLGEVLLASLLVGTLMALFLGGLGLLLSLWAGSQRTSLGLALFLLLALHAPAMMPAASLRGWAGEAVQRLDPFTQGFPYLDQMVLQGHPIGQDLGLLTPLVVAAVALPALALLAAGRLTLVPRGRS
ncbi:ABC transporter permease [Knoellia sp. p5-6-4]|uniref:ABC transporter permease n=1 Tax=unclassified Knoellia TaxID=2618719 RepID=UPI0023DCABD3|nr:ABC transporter permease subunit [Knoellia sp. p5-6-4]MDF2144116.1 ABC transporter permease subunit [Knoellia sp. p5-6-4]